MWPEYTLQLASAQLRWRTEYGAAERGPFQDRARFSIYAPDNSLLAYEGQQTGIIVWSDGTRYECPMPADPDSLRVTKTSLTWQHIYDQPGLAITAEFKKRDDQTVQCVLRFKALRDIASPHFSWGLQIASGTVNHYHWTQSPTQMAYSYPDHRLTLWMLSTCDPAQGIKRFTNCQALIAEHPDPQSLEFHLRMPPGYADPTDHPHTLKRGQTAELRTVLALRPGWFYQHRKANQRIQPMQKHPPRYPYKRYIDLAVKQFMDPRKFHPEHKGIMYYTAVDGTADAPQFQDWTEGPSWGGAWEVENAYNLILYARDLAPASKHQRYHDHARRMLDGFLTNPKYRVPRGVHYQQKGDMDHAMICTYWFPDFIWTGGQADFIYRLSQIYALTQWPDCLTHARQIAQWALHHQAPDGSVPTLWQFPVRYSEKLISHGWRPDFSLCHRKNRRAELIVDYQPATSAFLVLALFELYDIDKQPQWRTAALKLLQRTADALEHPLAEFGNGELDYLVYRARCMDPTGLSYIIRCFARAYQITQKKRYLNLLTRYTDTLLAYGVAFDFKETLLRPREKTTLGPYKTDIRLAGGITHANWRPIYGRGFGGRFNLLMNRNEMADALLAAWQTTQNPDYKHWLQAYANWQTYFQFLGEVPNSPVSTKGSAPQNHFWTTDFGNWNNDYALTAHKWIGSYLHLARAGFKGTK